MRQDAGNLRGLRFSVPVVNDEPTDDLALIDNRKSPMLAIVPVRSERLAQPQNGAVQIVPDQDWTPPISTVRSNLTNSTEIF